MEPVPFYRFFVIPAVETSKRAPLDVRLATEAIAQLDNFAEQVILARDPSIKEVSPERDRLGERNWAVRVCRDVHDTHKHGPLRRKTAKIKSGYSIRRRLSLRPYNKFAYNTTAFGGAKVWGLFIQEDEGATYDVSAVIEECVRFWRAELGIDAPVFAPHDA